MENTATVPSILSLTLKKIPAPHAAINAKDAQETQPPATRALSRDYITHLCVTVRMENGMMEKILFAKIATIIA